MARVRIRKAGPGEKAGYYNKAAMFLKKAQDGAEVQSASEQQTTQDNQAAMLKAYYEYAYDQLMNDVSVDDVLGELISKGLPQQLAYNVVNTLVEELTSRGQLNPDYKRAKEAQQQQSKEQPAQQEIIDEWSQNSGPDANQEQEDQSMYEEDQDMADLEEGYVNDDSHIMAMGGFFEDGGENPTAQDNVMSQYDSVKDNKPAKFDMQEMIENTPGIQPNLNFPSLAEYMPNFAGSQWQNVEALDEPLYRRGGNIPKKRDFVKNVMSLLKKQDGGEGEKPEDKNKPLGKGNRMDTLTEDVKKHRDNFLSAVKEKATTVKTEEMYDKLMQSNDPEMQKLAMQGQQPMQQPMQQGFQTGGYTGGEQPLYKFTGGGMELDYDANPNPPYYEADFLPEGKYGYSVGNLIRASRGLAGPGGMNPDEVEPKKEEPKVVAPAPAPTNVQLQPEPEIRNATVRYVPQYGGYSGTWHRNLTPWNPLVSRSMQMIGSPYVAGTHTPYRDPLAGLTPVARQVTKRGLFGRPKRYTDFYATSQMAGSPLPYNDKPVLVADGNTLKFVSPDSMNNPLQKNLNQFDFSNSEGLGLKARAAILAGEMSAKRNARRLERNPELLESSVPQIPYVNTSYLPDPSTIDQRVYDQNDPNFLMQKWEGPVNINEIPGGSAMTAYAYGGSLNRFIPKAAPGIQVQDPNLPQPAPGNPDMTMGAQPGLLGNPVQGPGTLWGAQASFNQPAPTSSAVTSYNSNPMNNMPVEPQGEDLTNCTPEQKRDSTSKCYCSPEARKDPNNKRCFDSLVAADVKQVNNVDTEAALNVGNAAVRGVTGILDRRNQRRQERQLYDNMTTDNLYASQGIKHRGDWVDLGSMAGQYGFDKMGQDESGFSSYGKFGGYMQSGGVTYNQGDEVYMSDQDIQNFMANGGEIEYLED